MRRDDALRIALVRAVEEALPERIPPERLLEAHAAAGEPEQGEPWIARRAAYLVDHALAGYRDVIQRAEVRLSGAWPFVLAAALVGLASNYLGPTGRIHVVFNPIVILIAWNLAVYAALAVATAAYRARPAASSAAGAAARRGERPVPGEAPASLVRPGLVERVLLGRIASWFLYARRRVDDRLHQTKDAALVARRFAQLWWPAVRPALGCWIRRLVHLGAIGLAVGAVAGMYVRGLFFQYDVVWRSTFVNDPTVIAWGLRILLGPAALLLGRPVPSPDDVLGLLSDAGDPAAPWIHLYAVSALLYIVVPRAVLAVLAGRRLHALTDDVPLDLDAEYFRDLLRRARAVSPERLEATIRGAARDECRRFTDRLATYVCDELYDGRIVPRLREFRDQGGRLVDLKETLRRECELFGSQLAVELPRAQQDLEHALVGHVRRLLGDASLPPPRALGGVVARLDDASAGVATDFGDRLGTDLGAIVAGVVSTSVAMVVGTLSGGFGKSLGVALLVGVVHSGPVGWVIGALGGLAATGVALWAGRSVLRQGIEEVPLPAAVLRVTLWSSRFERIIAEGRKRCSESVRKSLAVDMEPLSEAIGDHVWSGLRIALGEFQRPRVST
jgi:hypothetical protein